MQKVRTVFDTGSGWEPQRKKKRKIGGEEEERTAVEEQGGREGGGENRLFKLYDRRANPASIALGKRILEIQWPPGICMGDRYANH